MKQPLGSLAGTSNVARMLQLACMCGLLAVADGTYSGSTDDQQREPIQNRTIEQDPLSSVPNKSPFSFLYSNIFNSGETESEETLFEDQQPFSSIPEGYKNNFFTDPEDLIGRPPTFSLCTHVCTSPRSVLISLRKTHALGLCDCSELAADFDLQASNTELDTKIKTIMTYINTNTLGASLYESVYMAAKIDNDIISYLGEIAILFAAGFLPRIWAWPLSVCISFVCLFYGAPYYGAKAFISLCVRISYLILMPYHDVRDTTVYSVSLSYLVASVAILSTDHYSLLLFVSIFAFTTHLGGIATFLGTSRDVVKKKVEKDDESKVTSAEFDPIDTLTYVGSMRFFCMISNPMFVALSAAARTGENDMEKCIIAVSLLIFSACGGCRVVGITLVSTLYESFILCSVTPTFVITFFFPGVKVPPMDVLMAVSFILCALSKATGFMAVRMLSSGRAFPFLSSRRDIKYDKNDTTFFIMYYVRYFLHIAQSLVAFPSVGRGMVYSVVVNAINLYYLSGFLDVVFLLTTLGWSLNAVIYCVVPSLSKVPIFPEHAKSKRREDILARLKKENLLSVEELDRINGLPDAPLSLGDVKPADWEFEKERSLLGGLDTDSVISSHDVHNMYGVSFGIRTRNGHCHAVQTGPNEIRTVSHAFSDDISDFDGLAASDFAIHIDGKTVHPIRVSYYNRDDKLGEAIMILIFEPDSLRKRPQYIPLCQSDTKSVGVLMVGNDGFRIDHKELIETSWGPGLFRYRFFTTESDSGKPIFSIKRNGGVAIIALHFAKSTATGGNVGLPIHPIGKTVVLFPANEGLTKQIAPEIVDTPFQSMFAKIEDELHAFSRNNCQTNAQLAGLIKQSEEASAEKAAKTAKNKIRNARRKAAKAEKSKNVSAITPVSPELESSVHATVAAGAE